ncbi:hypothetical protein A2767_04485 [Candidatus Roizmanbacteria bacterium RIFCSPHIGHO2_01_FULL_35_10]|uniref:Uncharacterized protein n=1 Tax=Candidatus Roizmanbacteria bacterium RIFCSPLOWO2_01_FULL_35_13 TaxID=1802055 RepID=A0A1F7IH14_9BACT|nr:MAG: hypothetical protein A2767_04485 [Candidatus Roizmanbacteria bacterium RIFCSPHIGHO2_01_FULL_35_10]OGK42649.1 MAG: hypothetical protein A3A74_06465 [Candidatus Roizmanbacteria bacterium RIFCSPLOWO2_01_FULL_35_13]
MLNQNSAAYTGKEKTGGFSGVIAENNFLAVFEIEEGINSDQGKEMLQKIKEEVPTSVIENLGSFDRFISQVITKYNFPSSFSLAAGYIREKVMYLKTGGMGRIYLKRGNNFAQIIENDNSASGYIEAGDFYIFTTKRFIDVLGSDIELKTVFDHKGPAELIEDFKSLLKERDDAGAVSLFTQFKEDQIEENRLIEAEESPKENSFLTLFKDYSQKIGKKKILTFTAVIAILFILIWSVVLGYQRRSRSEINKKIKSTKELVTLKLDQAEEVAFLNLPRSMNLLSEAKQEVEKLKKEIGDRSKEIEEMENLVKNTESKIVKKEDKNYEEFYDLTLDSKGAKGDKLYLEKENLSIIDRGKGTVYILSLSKKSLDKNNSSEIKKASGIAAYQDYVLFYVEGEDVFKISIDDKSKKVINKDKDWGEINDMWIYNGNLYLLDSGKGDIYKYLVAENGYSEKNSYLKGNAGSIKGANSIAIDSSVYIGLDDEIIKYTAGAKDDFSTSWPEKNVKFTKIFTSTEVEKVYGWDKTNGAIYVLGKNGTYERQINSSILSKASDFVVFNNSVYVLVGEKIYKIGLE